MKTAADPESIVWREREILSGGPISAPEAVSSQSTSAFQLGSRIRAGSSGVNPSSSVLIFWLHMQELLLLGEFHQAGSTF